MKRPTTTEVTHFPADLPDAAATSTLKETGQTAKIHTPDGKVITITAIKGGALVEGFIADKIVEVSQGTNQHFQSGNTKFNVDVQFKEPANE